DRVSGGHVGLLVAQLHAAAAAREEVDLLGHAVVVLLGVPARRDGRLGEALVHRVAGRRAGELAYLRAVLRNERVHAVQSLLAHGSEATAVADLGDVRPRLVRALAAVAREAHSVVEGVRAVVGGEGPDDGGRVAAVAEVVQGRVHQGPPHAAAPRVRRNEHAAHLADLGRRVGVAVRAAAHVALQLARV